MNYNPEKASSNAEFVSGQSCAREILQDNIMPSNVVTDGVGGGALYRGINSVAKEEGYIPVSIKIVQSTCRRHLDKICVKSNLPPFN